MALALVLQAFMVNYTGKELIRCLYSKKHPLALTYYHVLPEDNSVMHQVEIVEQGYVLKHDVGDSPHVPPGEEVDERPQWRLVSTWMVPIFPMSSLC